MSRVSLKVKQGGSFELNEEGMTKTGPASLGTDTATLHIERMLGRPLDALGPEVAAMPRERRLTMLKDRSIRLERPGDEPVLLKPTRGDP
jgi:hypothetical protein